MNSSHPGVNQDQGPTNGNVFQPFGPMCGEVRRYGSNRAYDEAAYLRGQGLVHVEVPKETITPEHKDILDAKVILIIGGPGVGKSTIAATLASEMNLVHIDAVAIVRRLAATTPRTGWKTFCQQVDITGSLPSRLLVNMIKREIFRHMGFGRTRFVVDGFPHSREEFDLLNQTFNIKLVLHLMARSDTMEIRYMQNPMTFQQGELRLQQFKFRMTLYSASLAELTAYDKFSNIMVVMPADAEFPSFWSYAKSIVEIRLNRLQMLDVQIRAPESTGY